MFKCILAIVLSLTFGLTNAQVLTDSTLIVTSYWEIGDVFTYNVAQQETRIKGKKESLVNTSYTMQLEVTRASNSSYTMECTYTNFATDAKLSKEEKNIIDLYDGLMVRYKVSEFGDFLDVLNWKEIRSMAEDIVKATVAGKVDTLSDSTVDMLLNLTMAQFSTKDQIETFLIQDIRQLHYLHRLIISRVNENTYEKYYVNPFMDEHFSGVESHTIEDIDKFDQTAIVIVRAELPKENTNKLMRDYMINLVENLGGSASDVKDEDIPVYSIRESSRYTIDYDLGVVEKLSYKKKTSGQDNSTAISYKYKLID